MKAVCSWINCYFVMIGGAKTRIVDGDDCLNVFDADTISLMKVFS